MRKKKKNSVCVKGYQVTDTHGPAAKANLLCVTCHVYRSPTSSVGGVWQKRAKKPRTKKRKESELKAVCIDMYIRTHFPYCVRNKPYLSGAFSRTMLRLCNKWERIDSYAKNNVFHYVSSSKHANSLISSPSLLNIIKMERKNLN